MTSLTHMVAGLAVTQIVPDPVISLPLALTSHFVLDAIPHNDYLYNFVGHNWEHMHESPVSLVLLGLGIALSFYLSWHTPLPQIALAGAALGILPDALSTLMKRLDWKDKALYRFHKATHSHLDLGELFYNLRHYPHKSVRYPKSTVEFKDNYREISQSFLTHLGWVLESAAEIIFLILLLALIV